MSRHADIRNLDLYQDRTVQDWHRDAFPSTFHAMDVDLMGYCHICRTPLYALEATTNPQKGYTVMKKLSEIASMPGFVVYHDRNVVTSSMHIADKRTFNRDEFEQVIHKIRRHHHERHHA